MKEETKCNKLRCCLYMKLFHKEYKYSDEQIVACMLYGVKNSIFKEYITELYEIGVDAVLIADPGIFSIAHQVAPDLEIHLSTQASNLNYKTASFWHKAGIKRVVAAREMSLEELKTMRKELPETCDIEAFVHGAMCMGISGKCLLSNYMTGRDSNRGTCTQPCRYKYHLYEEKEQGDFHKVNDGDDCIIYKNSS
ncbi:peptidase U32 family protein [Clostridium sp. WILCCON 0112]|uniref:Peptidase U32 family protein n=1 Tax=Candidatus Clostridium helianthi TaxID=3381660 RepID=A0ABW8SBR7_9CLOT